MTTVKRGLEMSCRRLERGICFHFMYRLLFFFFFFLLRLLQQVLENGLTTIFSEIPKSHAVQHVQRRSNRSLCSFHGGVGMLRQQNTITTCSPRLKVLQVIVSMIFKAIYNVKFHPLAKFPGPRAAAISHVRLPLTVNRHDLPD